MKTFLKILFVLLILLVGYALYVMGSTGFFRSIENTYSGSIIQYDVPGAEDFAIDRDEGFMIISSDDRAARRDGNTVNSGLYYLNLKEPNAQPKLIKATNDVPLYPHGISMHKIDSGIHRLLVVNHVTASEEAVSSLDPEAKHYIEEYLFKYDTLTHITSHEGDLVFSPNDVVAIDDRRFYFSNDHGSKTKLGLLCEDFLGFRRSNVVYYDGTDFQKVADDIAYANGINYDAMRNLLYVASPRDFLVKVYEVGSDGSLTFETDIDCNTGVDNIELDERGEIWIGCHPKLLAFSSYAAGSAEYAPSEVIKIDYNSSDDYNVESVYVSDGTDASAATTAIPYQGRLYIGNVMDGHFIALGLEEL